MEQERGLQDTYPRAGFHAECAEWMHQREAARSLAATASRSYRIRASGFRRRCTSATALVSMGLPILDWPALTALAETCDREKRWDFLFTTAPMRDPPRATSAPVNPLCLF